MIFDTTTVAINKNVYTRKSTCSRARSELSVLLWAQHAPARDFVRKKKPGKKILFFHGEIWFSMFVGQKIWSLIECYAAELSIMLFSELSKRVVIRKSCCNWHPLQSLWLHRQIFFDYFFWPTNIENQISPWKINIVWSGFFPCKVWLCTCHFRALRPHQIKMTR